jgi:hypothetical protein
MLPSWRTAVFAVSFGVLVGGWGALGIRRPVHARWSERALSDVERGWSLPPARRAALTLSYDALPFRNPAGRQKADVALVGDSYVEGAHNDDVDVVARRLEGRLGAQWRALPSLALARCRSGSSSTASRHASGRR